MKTWIVSKRDKIRYLIIADNAMLALAYLADITDDEFTLDDVRSGVNKNIFKIN